MKRDHLVVVVGHRVDAATVCADGSRSHHRHQNLLPLVRKLGFVADQDVVLHGKGDVVHGELQEGTLWDIDQTDTCPGGSAVVRVGPRNHGHSLGQSKVSSGDCTTKV